MVSPLKNIRLKVAIMETGIETATIKVVPTLRRNTNNTMTASSTPSRALFFTSPIELLMKVAWSLMILTS